MSVRYDEQDEATRDLAFSGEITASLSHQLNNVFTIINEVNGLIEDLLWAEGQGQPLPPPKLAEIAQRIAAQVARGTEQVRRLNRFAHSTDDRIAEQDLAELVALTAAICQRFVDLKRARLELCLPDAPLVLRTSPFLVLQAVFHAVRIALEAGGEGAELTLALSGEAGRAQVRVGCSAETLRGDEVADRWRQLERVAVKLGAQLTEGPGEDGDGGRALVLALASNGETDLVGR